MSAFNQNIKIMKISNALEAKVEIVLFIEVGNLKLDLRALRNK